MEIVSVSTGVGEVIGGTQTPTSPSTFQPQHHNIRSCLPHQDPERCDEEDEELEDDIRMETEDEPNDLFSNSPQQGEDRSCLDEDSGEDQMEFGDNAQTSFIDDEDDSSSRVFPDDGNDVGISSPPPKSSSRKNKRKNFQPRNIIYFPDSDDEDEEGEEDGSRHEHESPLDLSETPIRRSLLPRRLEENSPLLPSGVLPPHLVSMFGGNEGTSLAEQTMRRFLNLCGFQENLSQGIAGTSLLSGKILETLKANGNDPNSSQGGGGSLINTIESNNDNNNQEQPPTPPHTPQRDLLGVGSTPAQEGSSRNVPLGIDSVQQQALQARILGERNFSTLLTLAALQEGHNSSSGIPLPPTLDPNKSIPTTPTTPTSTAVTPGLASLSLQNGDSTPPTMVPTLGSVRDHLSKQSIDYSRYVKRYLSALECGNPACRELNHREHFHCLDCNCKIFSKKEEMIRHFKWHKKRDESLQHGFMRYSPNDDCSDRFSSCSHNRKQTHYHCLKESCDKVYISTSDVQMHANYHRKDSAIMQEGFQRFRASEDCNDISCSFSGQRTTHFHCIRSNCNYNFKNKADMEKHKTYHIKDEQLTKDGFKKFMKQEDCGYDACKLSKVANHIHCIRSECNYVLHSSGQIFAHKLACISNHQRKHERQEHEKAYRKYKLAQTMLGVSDSHPTLNPLLHEALRPLGGLGPPMIGPFGGDSRNEDSSSPMGCGGSQGPSMLPATSGISRPGHPPFLMGNFPPPGLVDGQHPLARLLGVPPPAAHNLFPGAENNSNSTPTSSSSGPASPVDLSVSMNSTDERDWERFVRCYSRDESCRSSCELSGLEHWHCEECEALFHTRDSAKEHGKVHEQQVAITEENYIKILPGENSSSCPAECQIQDQAEHYHCNWDGCGEAILSSGDKPFRRLEHFRIHDFARRLPSGVTPGMGVGVASVTSVDAMFKRKRGRPPKNRIIEVWNEYLPVSSSNDSPQAIFTSFKLPKSSPPLPPSPMTGPNVPANPLLGFIPPGMSPLSHLAHMGREIPSSGIMPGAPLPPPLALSAAKKGNMLPLSEPIVENPPQPQAELVDGFYLWEEGVLCSDQLCPHIGRRHFHCAHPRCLYVTLNSETLSIHSDDFHENTQILDGFMYFDRNINCRMSSCQSNTINKHFHCTKCGYSFIRYQAMETHNEKHQQEEEDDQTSHTLGPLSPIYLQKQRPDSPMETPSNNCLSTSSDGSETPSKSQPLVPVVKSSGIFYPLSPFPSASQGAPRSTSSTTNSEPGALVTPIPPSTRPTTLPTYTLPVSGCLSITATRRSPGLPSSFSPVQQEIMDQDESEETNKKFDSPGIESVNHSSEQTNVNDLSVAPVLSPSNERNSVPDIIPEQENGSQSQFEQEISCGRPFCKLKKKEHFHCQICNQAFSEHEKLRSHIMKHMSGYTGNETTEIEIEDDDDESDIKQEDNQENCEDKKFSSEELSREQAPFSPQSTAASIIPNPILIPGLTSSTSPRAVITSMSCPQPPPQFTNPLIYSQAASFHGLPGPFGPHFGISSMFPGSLPRFLPPGPWPGMHPALAAMAHPHLMLPQVRPNGEMPQVPQSVSQCNVPSMSSVVGVQAGMTPPGDRSPIMHNSLNTSPHLAILGKRLGPDDFSIQEAKKIRASHSIRMLKDEPVPEGYIRFRFNEDCQYPHCGYREHQTHFHCMRKDCGYSFCDKTRFVQHTARHERLDTLMGGDFHQYRSNVPCGRSECVYSSMIGQQQNKASHFHCLKCDFVCTDTNKVVAHRRQHQKRDSINAAGFEKFTPSQPCGVQSCTHNQKQTHYHCLKCQYSVLGLSQMSAHKFRHVE